MPVGRGSRGCLSLSLSSARCCCCRCCCCCRVVGAAPVSARPQLSSGPARVSMPVGLGTRSCLSLSLSFALTRACAGIGAAPAPAVSALRLRLCPARLSRCWCRWDGSCCGGKSPFAPGLQLGSRAVLLGLASVASTLRLRLCPTHLSRCCCWCRCSGRSFSGCVCAGAWVAFTSARLQFSTRPARGSLPVGLGTRACLSLSRSLARARACVGVGVAPT